MSEKLDLTGDIAAAIDGAALRGNTVVVGYVDDDGYASMSFRGSTQVYGPDQIAIWSRTTDSGLPAVVSERPKVSLLYFSPDGPGAHYLSIFGRARVDPSANERVYADMLELERDRDPEAKGVAVIIDVDSVKGAGADMQPIHMER
jgi:hypothetical protein